MDERDIITLYDEDGQETEFEVLGVINVDDKDYAIWYLLDDEIDIDEEEAYIFRVDTDENGEDVLVEVEDDDEFERIANAWKAVCEEDFDDEDFDEEDFDDEDE